MARWLLASLGLHPSNAVTPQNKKASHWGALGGSVSWQLGLDFGSGQGHGVLKSNPVSSSALSGESASRFSLSSCLPPTTCSLALSQINKHFKKEKRKKALLSNNFSTTFIIRMTKDISPWVQITDSTARTTGSHQGSGFSNCVSLIKLLNFGKL